MRSKVTLPGPAHVGALSTMSAKDACAAALAAKSASTSPAACSANCTLANAACTPCARRFPCQVPLHQPLASPPQLPRNQLTLLTLDTGRNTEPNRAGAAALVVHGASRSAIWSGT